MKYIKEQRTGMETYQLWASRIQSAIYWRQNYYNGDVAWRRAYRDFGGDQWNNRVEEGYDLASDNLREEITVNVMMSHVLTMGPFLVNNKASFKATPRKPNGYVSAMIQENVLNYEYTRKKIHKQLRKCIYDDLIIGHGVAKTGFIRKLDEATIAQAGEINYEDYITDESIFARRTNPLDFYFDPNASERSLETARWCCERYYKYYNDVIVNDVYNPRVLRKIKSGEYPLNSKESIHADSNWTAGYDLNQGIEYQNPEAELVCLYEIWDKKHNKYYVFADGCPEPLLEKDTPYDYLQGEFPYCKVDFVLPNNEWYGLGIPYLITDQAYELNRHRTFSFHHRRRFSARKYEVLQSIDTEELDKLQFGEDGAYVRVPNTNSIKPIEDVPLPRDYPVIEALIKGDIESMIGIDALIRGGQLPSRTTAGEVGTRVNIFTSKLAHRIEDVDDFFLSVGNQLNSHIGANYLKENVVRIVGDQGEYFVTYSNEDLKDEIILTMETVSAPKTDPTVERNQRIQLFNGLIQQAAVLTQLQQPLQVDFNEMLKWVLESFGNKDFGRFFKLASRPVVPPGQNGEQNPAQLAQPSAQPMNAQDLLKQMSGAAVSPAALNGSPV